MSTRVAVALILIAGLLGGCAPDPLPGAAASEELVEIHRGDVTLVGTLVVPALDPGERVPIALLLPGWQSGREERHLVGTAEQLAEQGVASLRVDFTGHGLSDGEASDFASAAEVEVEDARAIAAYATALPFVDRLHVVGYSLGGLVAAVFAGERAESEGLPVASLTLLAPASPYGIRLPVFDAASGYRGPVLILLGESDDLVSPDIGERYRAAFDDAVLVTLPHENHDFTYGTDVAGMTTDFILHGARADSDREV